VTEEPWTTFRLQALRRELAELQQAIIPGDPVMGWNEQQRAALDTVMDAIVDTLDAAG